MPRAALAKARDARSAALAEDTTDAGFYAYAVGEYARLAGDPSLARTAFLDALAVRPDDPAALVGLARIDAFDGRADAAIAGLRRATEIAPQPEALALLGDLLTEAGDEGAVDAYATVRFIEQLGDIQATTFDRQLLRFELDHEGATTDVLDQARASVAQRPEWTGHDTVAWALYRLGRFRRSSDRDRRCPCPRRGRCALALPRRCDPARAGCDLRWHPSAPGGAGPRTGARCHRAGRGSGFARRLTERPPVAGGQSAGAGRMFWFRWKTLSGSYFRLRSASRASCSAW